MAARVGLFLPSLRGGGAERAAVTLANALAASGVEVEMLLARAEGPYLAHLAPAVEVVDFGLRRVVQSIPALASRLRRGGLGAVLSTVTNANLALLAARHLAGAPVRVVVREGNTLSEVAALSRGVAERLLPTFARRFYPSADLILANSRGVAEDLVASLGLPAASIRVLPNPVALEPVRQAAREAPGIPLPEPTFPLLVAAGRLVPQKDFLTLLRAVALLRERLPVHLALLGEGPERGRLEAEAARLGLSTALSLPGFLPNPHAVMARARALVLSSRWEGMPNVLLEAMALGVPVVATDCPSGPRELLAEGRFGPLVPVGDAPALAAAIAATLASPPAGEELRARAAAFDVTALLPAYLAALGIAGGA